MIVMSPHSTFVSGRITMRYLIACLLCLFSLPVFAQQDGALGARSTLGVIKSAALSGERACNWWETIGDARGHKPPLPCSSLLAISLSPPKSLPRLLLRRLRLKFFSNRRSMRKCPPTCCLETGTTRRQVGSTVIRRRTPGKSATRCGRSATDIIRRRFTTSNDCTGNR